VGSPTGSRPYVERETKGGPDLATRLVGLKPGGRGVFLPDSSGGPGTNMRLIGTAPAHHCTRVGFTYP